MSTPFIIIMCILFLARPMDQSTINYLMDISKILSGESNLDADEKSDILFHVTSVLDVTEKQLQDCKGKNIRITVRQIMKMKYPDPPLNFKFTEVDRKYIGATRGKNNGFLYYTSIYIIIYFRLCTFNAS
jgi:hypothetical protein